MSPKVSVVIPVYNVSEYLRECISSVCDQTLEDIEIIAINDGSTDDSLAVLNELSESDSRIKVYTHTNRGLGETRNRGIELSQGEYIAFVDSDDFIAVTALEKLVEIADECEADVVQGTTFFTDSNGVVESVRKELTGIPEIKISENTLETFYRDYYFTGIFTPNGCDKLYRLEKIKNNHIKFGDNKRIFAEDNWFQLQFIQTNPKVEIRAVDYYFYRQQEKSIMHSPKKDLVRRHEQMMSDFSEIVDIHQESANRKARALLGADVFAMVVLDALTVKKTYREYMISAKQIRTQRCISQCILDINREKAYQFEKKKCKRIFLRTISFLQYIHFYWLEESITWLVYKMKNPRGI